jgi:HD-GYP domain-containing protein (c-di-GMP phosphodiesterase class II)
MGLITVTITSTWFPQSYYEIDGIDLSNRILLYMIVATLSYLLFSKLFSLYKNQVNIIVESMERTIEQTVKSFVIAIEFKDQYTFGHSERVCQYAIEIGKSIKHYHNQQNLTRLKLSSLVHDIGKINIPESILASPNRLTKKEFEIIKTHPVVGAQMVERITNLEELKPGVLYHHEKWDGKGYPSGIKGEEIPLDARVIAIADALDAMTSTRAYRDPIPFDDAFNCLKLDSGTHFDPVLINKLDIIKPRLQKIYDQSFDPIKEFERLTDYL